MTVNTTRIDELAQQLWTARIAGKLVDIPANQLSLDQAYAVQDRIVELSAQTARGWKVGSTSAAAQAKLGTKEPGAGPLLRDYCFDDGADVPVFPVHGVFIEAEFAFRIGEPIACEPDQLPSHEQLARRIESFVPAIEVVGSRLKNGINNSGRELVTADGGANIAFVGGAPCSDWRSCSLAEHAVTVRINGVTQAQGVGADALGHPLNVLQWLTQHCARRNKSIDAGTFVSTGTCSGLIAVGPGDTVEADFGALGRVGFQVVNA